MHRSIIYPGIHGGVLLSVSLLTVESNKLSADGDVDGLPGVGGQGESLHVGIGMNHRVGLVQRSFFHFQELGGSVHDHAAMATG